MSKRLRMGFVGAGSISQRVLPHMLVDDVRSRVDVTGICDPVLERARLTARNLEIANAYATFDEMLTHDDIDAVTLASPIGLHYEQGLAAIRAGKHVHFNKTMTITADEATHLITEAASHDVRLVSSPGEMLRPHNVRVKEIIQSGEIGTVSWAACGAAFGTYHVNEPERGGDNALHNVDPSWYFRVPGGGPLYDMTVYALHGLTGVLGSVRRLTALSGIRIPNREHNGRKIEVDAHDNTLILLDFGHNLFAFCYGTAAGILTSGAEFDFSGRYYGTDGTIEGLHLNGEPFDYPGRDLALTAPDKGVQPGDGGNEWLLPHISPAHRELRELHVFEDLMQLVDWAVDGQPSIATAEHARHVIEIIEMAYEAAESGQTQTLTTSVDGLHPV